jgi:hypothetical protein
MAPIFLFLFLFLVRKLILVERKLHCRVGSMWIIDLGHCSVQLRPAAPVCIRVRWQAEWLQVESCFDLSASVLKPLAFRRLGPGTLYGAVTRLVDYPDRYVAQQINEELLTRLIEGNLHAQPDSHWTFYVPANPSLPAWPAPPNRTRFAAVGLFAGLLAGLTLAGVTKSRSSTIVLR